MKPPKYLYRYQSFPENGDKLNRLKEMFLNHQFYASCPLWFNDPFDCRARLSAKGMNDYWLRQFAQINLGGEPPNRRHRSLQAEANAVAYKDAGLQNVVDEMQNAFQLGLTNIGMLCFSELYDNILMWSHYADGHKG